MPNNYIVTDYFLDFRLEALHLQNQFRSVHRTPPLDLDGSLSVHAEQIATQLAKDGSAKKDDILNSGENVMKSCNANYVEVSADEAIRKW
jgi:hypothetical protein